jgi:nucleoside 2-deoxyribosyltransferase
MDVSFREIDRSDLVVLEMSEKGVGLGIEAGYAHARDIPIIVLIKAGREVSTTLAGIAAHIIAYEAYEDIRIPALR